MHKKKELTAKQQKGIKIAALIIAVIVIAGLTAAVAIPMLSFAKEPEIFREWVDENLFLSSLAYVGMVVFQIVAAFIPGDCAERTAFCKAVSEGEKTFRAICIVGGKEGVLAGQTAPCGVCRQVMMEFCDPDDFEIILPADETHYQIYTLKQLLPLWRHSRLYPWQIP